MHNNKHIIVWHTRVIMGIDTNMQSLHNALIVWNKTGVNTIISGGEWLYRWILQLKGIVTGVARAIVELNRERISEIPCNIHPLWGDPLPYIGTERR